MKMLASHGFETLTGYLDRCSPTYLSCEPADRRAAEEGVRLAYAAAGLSTPHRIEWCSGPVEIAAQLASVSADADVGTNVRSEIYDRIQDKVSMLAEIFWKEILVSAATVPSPGIGDVVGGDERCRRIGTAVSRVVCEGMDGHLFDLRTRARHAVRRLRGKSRLLPACSFAENAIGPSQFMSLSACKYLHDNRSDADVTAPLRGLWQIGASAGWVVPYERVCWLSERPSVLSADARGRLHCADGPALRYRDGWSAYAWKGTQVHDWMIEHPEQITPRTVSDTFDPILRNCMIEIMTPQRFVESGDVSRVSQDECGVLWRRLWGYRGTTTGSWTAVEVVNGTAERDGNRKRYFLRVPSSVRTAREAVAWSYGLPAQDYAQLEIRT